MSALKLEVGKTYVDREGNLMTVTSEPKPGKFEVHAAATCESQGWTLYAGNQNGWRSRDGRYKLDAESEADLIAEANTTGASAHMSDGEMLERCDTEKRFKHCSQENAPCRHECDPLDPSKCNERGKARLLALTDKPSIPHADLIRAVLDGKVVQRLTAEGPDQWGTYTDPKHAIKELCDPFFSDSTFRLKPEPVKHWHPTWRAREGNNGTYIGSAWVRKEYALQGWEADNGGPGVPPDAVICIKQDPDTLDVISAKTEMP